jgi:hypothetical protein
METSDQEYIYTFMQRSMRFLMDINQGYLRLLSSECFKYEPPFTAHLSLNENLDNCTSSIILNKDDVAQITEGFSGKDKVKVPLDDPEYIEGIIGLSYRKAYALMALLLTQSDEMKKITKIKLELLGSRGPEIFAKLTYLEPPVS